MFKSSNIISIKEASRLTNLIRLSKSLKIGLSHGGFDLLHPGHIAHLKSARELCNLLFVSITSDRFIKQWKGFNRPILDENQRAYMVANLKDVNYVVISDFKTAVKVIKKIKPSLYIKGPDYIDSKDPDLLKEIKAIKKIGGKMRYTQDTKLSTTDIIKKIKGEKNGLENL